jgi:hypothetical protein
MTAPSYERAERKVCRFLKRSDYGGMKIPSHNETPHSKLRGIRRKRYLIDYAASCGESHPARD